MAVRSEPSCMAPGRTAVSLDAALSVSRGMTATQATETLKIKNQKPRCRPGAGALSFDLVLEKDGGRDRD